MENEIDHNKPDTGVHTLIVLEYRNGYTTELFVSAFAENGPIMVPCHALERIRNPEEFNQPNVVKLHNHHYKLSDNPYNYRSWEENNDRMIESVQAGSALLKVFQPLILADADTTPTIILREVRKGRARVRVQKCHHYCELVDVLQERHTELKTRVAVYPQTLDADIQHAKVCRWWHTPIVYALTRGLVEKTLPSVAVMWFTWAMLFARIASGFSSVGADHPLLGTTLDLVVIAVGGMWIRNIAIHARKLSWIEKCLLGIVIVSTTINLLVIPIGLLSFI